MAEDILSLTLRHLEALVGFDTRNPPRHISVAGGIFEYISDQLPDFNLEFEDLGDGCISLLAVRGTPRHLFNVHIDTVPADANWTQNPHQLTIEGGRATGLGACDIKGAAACLIAAARSTKGDMAMLFSSDEEAGKSRCVRSFCEKKHPFDAVIVAEPTNAKAILEHRGLATCTAHFTGTAGHSSSPTALEDSAIHQLTQWASNAVAHATAERSHTYRNLAGICLNIGVIEGGTKPNIVASGASARWGIRPLPSQVTEDVLQAIEALAPDAQRVTWERGFFGPSLPAHGRTDKSSSDDGGDVAPDARQLATDLGLPIGDPVNFWTEASLFSEAGYTALVYGPGDIAQAHTAGEWVSLADLEEVARAYGRIVG